MPAPEPRELEAYLRDLTGEPVRVTAVTPMAGPADLKAYGYGVPLRVDLVRGGESCQLVLETMRPGPNGHEHMADRAQAQLWAHRAFNQLPRHVRSLDVGALEPSGRLVSLGRAEELFLLTEMAPGRPYAEDLGRMRDTGQVTTRDKERADALCDYLSAIHARHGPVPSEGLYRRRLRELVGHGECILGLTDTYPEGHPLFPPERLLALEQRCLRWRWRLRDKSHRLRQVHGDFHPWNILFAAGADFTVLDRSRGEWGEPADDVTCLTLNYLFFAMQRGEGPEGPLTALFRRFWARYLERTGDREMLSVCGPFFAFRGLVMAHPVWYPDLDDSVRRRLMAFVEAVLEAPSFDPTRPA